MEHHARLEAVGVDVAPEHGGGRRLKLDAVYRQLRAAIEEQQAQKADPCPQVTDLHAPFGAGEVRQQEGIGARLDELVAEQKAVAAGMQGIAVFHGAPPSFFIIYQYSKKARGRQSRASENGKRKKAPQAEPAAPC